jgi:hypothetical protein
MNAYPPSLYFRLSRKLLAGIPGKRDWTPIKTFGGDAFGSRPLHPHPRISKEITNKNHLSTKNGK